MVLLAGIGIPENLRIRRSRILTSTQVVCSRSRSGYSSPPETEAGWHTDRDACFCRSALERHIPYSDRRSYNPSCGRSRTLCRVPPSARRLATNCSLSSITEHSFQGITPSLKKKRESVTYVFGTICHLCLESLIPLHLGGVAAPPVLARGRQGVNGVVILVEAGQRAGIVGFDAGLVIFCPVRDALLAVVFLELLHPAFADKGYVANNTRRGEAGKIAHDVELQLLRFADREAPMLGVGDYVALIKIVRHDFRVVEKREAKIEKVFRGGVDAAQKHSLISNVAKTHLQQFADGLGNQRRHLPRIIDVRVQREVDAALAGFLREPFEAAQDVILQEMLRNSHQAFGGQANVFDIRNVHDGGHKGFELRDGHIRQITAGNDDVAYRRRLAKIIEHLLVAILLRNLEAKLGHLRDVVANQVHARAMAAVLRTSGKHFGEYFCRIAMREPFDGPHVGFVQAVAAGFWMTRPFGVAIVEGRQHVATHGIVPEIFLIHGVEHLRRDEDGHGGALFDVALHALQKILRQQRTENGLEFSQILHGVAPLPERGFPFPGSNILVAWQATPIRLDERMFKRILEGLYAAPDFTRGMPDGARCFRFDHFHNPLAARRFPRKPKPSFRENAGRKLRSLKDTMD